ncbi:tRNA (adenosine(37)-N6)-dimethylallyltransferase MiaA [Fredinandcohnia quinoae]|uniref:tRNA dimethylallyltransferase n=1 Tax=Fredinandcohnia quinoae TaxID=2918902 RepID=A0AAW5DUI3_9BACI|nr:tRNA (adenosine(37)-N6)-dimethylallyltransferase MiaA [Fredinandcohnia sp. SECRCQ15]MCH1623698.1 tRNA (adenosine(37)-N6)-dimethylallyltransferase MiaA [Fredinandcohnia sp. SECRCQ15]
MGSNELNREKLVVLIGPTAVGKTQLSIKLAKQLNAEIISGDSMQIYRGMDIGTAKITEEEMEGIPHHLINIRNPEDPFSVAEFQTLVRECIQKIHERGKLPMIVGGTGLYIQSVIYDYKFTDTASDPKFRIELEQQIADGGALVLYDKLKKLDPESAKRIHPNNIRRLIRALEIIHTTGTTISENIDKQEVEELYDLAIVGLTMDREILYNRINKRVDIMMQQGLLNEVSSLYQSGLKDCQSIQAIGYKELYSYLEGKVTLETAVEQLKQNSRRYAKRQLTWFRNKMNVQWFTMGDNLHSEEKFKEIYKYIAGKLGITENR